MEFINFAEPLDERDNQIDLSMQVEFLRKSQALKGSLHAGHSGKISQYFLSALNQHVLIELTIIIEVYEQGKERMFIEYPYIISFVLIKDITEIDLQ